MQLRRLKEKDAPLMLEWMHDIDVVMYMSSNFASKSLEDCLSFIRNSQHDDTNLNLAIVTDEDEYMGTVSLKHINMKNRTAEFAITVRRSAMGNGYSWYGMSNIIKMAFNDLNLDSVYWCVSKSNVRACRFYDKHHFNELLDVAPDILDRYHGVNNLKWYIVNRDNI